MMNALTHPVLQALTHVGGKGASFGNVHQDMNSYLKVLYNMNCIITICLCFYIINTYYKAFFKITV